MQIQSTQAQFYGAKINLPIAGVVAIDANGMVEVSEAVAAILLTSSNDWVDPNATPDAEEIDAINAEEGAEGVTPEQMIAAIDSMPMDELLEFCETTQIKGYKQMKKNEKALRALVKNQLAKVGK